MGIFLIFYAARAAPRFAGNPDTESDLDRRGKDQLLQSDSV